MIAGLKPYPAYKDSGVQWLGKVPEHWDAVKLKAISRRAQNGSTPPTDSPEYYAEEGLPWYGPSSLSGAIVIGRPTRHVSARAILAGKVRPIDPPALAVSVIGNVGRSALVLERGATNQQITCFELKSDVCDGRFVTLQFRLAEESLVASASSATIAILDSWELRSTALALPPVPEQAAIVRFLDHVDRRIRRYIRAKQRLIRLLEEQKQAIIHRAVTRGLDPNVRLKPSGIEWLGDVPEHWEVRRTASFSPKITNGWVGPTRDILKESGVPYIQSLHVKRGTIRFVRKYFVAEEWLRAREKIRLRQGDVVVVQTGDIGQVASIPPEYDGAGCHALIIIRTNPQVVSGHFLDLVLRSAYGYESLKSLQTGALHPHLNCTWVREIFVAVPRVSEQEEILRHAGMETSSSDRAVAAAERELSLLREYRTRLITDVVTGKLDVRAAAAQLPDEMDEPDDVGAMAMAPAPLSSDDDDAEDAVTDAEETLDEAGA